MLIYKGFIKVSENGTFYPISKIKSLKPYCYNPLRTEVIFDDGRSVIFEYSMLKTIDMINGIKEEE